MARKKITVEAAPVKDNLVEWGPVEEQSDLDESSHALYKSTRDKQSVHTSTRKLDAISPVHSLEPNDGWKQHKLTWETSDEDTRKSIIYGMCVTVGAGRIDGKFILDYFGLKKSELEPYKEVIDMAQAALALKVQRNAISLALSRSDMWQAKEWLTRQFSQMVMNPVHKGVKDIYTPSNIFENLVVQQTNRDEHGRTISEPTELKLVKNE